MGSLSNLYISQSYISLLHFGSDSSASATLTEIQDGLGYSTGISMNNKGDLAMAGALTIGGGLTLSGSTKINTIYTSSTPQYVNSGNYYTDSIIRITGSFASGSATSPTINEVQIGWPVYGDGLVSGAVVINKQYVNANFVELTINQNTAEWFGLYYFTNPTPQYVNFSVSGSQDITGSLWVRDKITATNISASNAISASDLWVKNTIHAYKLDVTIESSSIIFTSGSNIIGDEANVDTQTLIGRVKVSGSLEVTSSIKATTDISSSTLNGIGNVTLYSASVNSRVSALENFSSSQYKTDSASFQSQITTNSASFAAYSSSLVSTFATNAFVLAQTASLSSSIYFTDSSQSARLTAIEFLDTTYATTGSNIFKGNQTITGSLVVTGSMIYSGSVRGAVNTLSIASNTASFDTSLGNFYTITLVSGSNTFINATNVNPGETISLLVTQPSVGYGTTTFSSNIKFPGSFPYYATPLTSSIDVLTFVSYGSTLYGVAVNRMV